MSEPLIVATPMKNHLTVTILTRNEERSIQQCLDSLEGLADEIVVVDSFSTDSTVDICRARGCRVSTRQFTGYGVQRQWATSLATHPYVLSIDADEVVSDQLRQELMRLKEEGFAHRIYAVPRYNYYLGRPVTHGGWHPDLAIRLFNKRYANWNLHDIGESVIFPDTLKPQALDGPLIHYRCAALDEFNRTEDRHAAIRSRVIAANRRLITPVEPALRGMGAWGRSYLRHAGFVEGAVGSAIAVRDFRTEVMAYRLARRILNKRRPCIK